MGEVTFPKNDPLKAPFDKIPVANWRTLGDLGNDKVEVVIARFHRFIIHDMTIDYFHLTNLHRYIVERKFRYVNNALACAVCHGSGKVDWIQKVRSQSRLVMDPHKNYWRDKNTINCLLPITQGYQVYHLYGSQPRIYEGQEVCGRCKGTGMESMKATQFLFEMGDE